MASKMLMQFKEEEIKVDQSLGYPRAYSKLCRNHSSFSLLRPYANGPPFVFLPYTLRPQEALRAKDLNQMFPVIDPDAIPSMNPRGYVNLLWKQLDHLGNAGFDPELFRVDPYGNVLYLHADTGSPLAWDIDHWFPCTRGGKTTPSNLRLLQWQVCRRKQNKLEFLIPWWELQLGISVNQFLSIFASRNSDFRSRAFSFLFPDGENEEITPLQTVDSHRFPQSFVEMKEENGLAPAAIVVSPGSLDASVLKPLDINRPLRSNSPLNGGRNSSAEEYDDPTISIQRAKPSISKENDDPQMGYTNANSYHAIAMARDSLRQRTEAKKKQDEVNQLERELEQIKQHNEAERIALQDLEALLISKRRRVEKCRRLAETQASYRALLEKMIRDAMHQAVVYKEQVRLNQVAATALKARLEAQRELSESSEKELHRRYKQRHEIEKNLEPYLRHARKRSRTDDTLCQEWLQRLFSSSRQDDPIRKELRLFLEEEHKASVAGSSPLQEEDSQESSSNTNDGGTDENFKASTLAKVAKPHNDSRRLSLGRNDHNSTDDMKGKSVVQSPYASYEECKTKMFPKNVDSKGQKFKIGQSNMSNEPRKETLRMAADETFITSKLNELGIGEIETTKNSVQAKNAILLVDAEEDQDEEQRNKTGEQNIEKWLKIMLDNSNEISTDHSEIQHQKHKNEQDGTGDDIRKTSKTSMHVRTQSALEDSNHACSSANKSLWGRKSFDKEHRKEKKEGGIVKCESNRGFRSLPSSPSMIFGMKKKGVDCISRKPKVVDNEIDNEARYDESTTANKGKSFKSWTRMKLVNRF